MDDFAELADVEACLHGERMDILAMLLGFVLVLGNEALPALFRELRHAVEPERVEFGAQIVL
jgi:hypothetical protein